MHSSFFAPPISSSSRTDVRGAPSLPHFVVGRNRGHVPTVIPLATTHAGTLKRVYHPIVRGNRIELEVDIKGYATRRLRALAVSYEQLGQGSASPRTSSPPSRIRTMSAVGWVAVEFQVSCPYSHRSVLRSLARSRSRAFDVTDPVLTTEPSAKHRTPVFSFIALCDTDAPFQLVDLTVLTNKFNWPGASFFFPRFP
ncbi:hypothetical protein MSAN_01364100 [Mycena sanguinolenta]|uniref:Uncharacterized protein n=1 Tax=Mycena sanguinolenta TaxID=230812 RepID=A0A8H6YAY3_9AGAR|nr:hypothetical protein MSAN_01364100 [Mycena sanguinolenta]